MAFDHFERPESVLLEISEQDWMMWRHNPITAAFLQFMDDQIAVWRDVAADCLEAGVFRSGDPHEDRDMGVVRGKLVAVRMLRGIDLATIQGFYGKAEAVEAEEAEPDE